MWSKSPEQRWSEGLNHHPKSKDIYRFISAFDVMYGDFFKFKSGGDGDNGEHLMYLLDAYFEYKESNDGKVI